MKGRVLNAFAFTCPPLDIAFAENIKVNTSSHYFGMNLTIRTLF
jgi:hypothetical protein